MSLLSLSNLPKAIFFSRLLDLSIELVMSLAIFHITVDKINNPIIPTMMVILKVASKDFVISVTGTMIPADQGLLVRPISNGANEIYTSYAALVR